MNVGGLQRVALLRPPITLGRVFHWVLDPESALSWYSPGLHRFRKPRRFRITPDNTMPLRCRLNPDVRQVGPSPHVPGDSALNARGAWRNPGHTDPKSKIAMSKLGISTGADFSHMD